MYKKDCKEHTENYRPISLLSVVSKVMERCVFNRIRERVYKLIRPCQHGFIEGRSCVTQLVKVLDIIGSHLDTGAQIDTVYLDMSKAFEKVNHRKLIKKLARFGFGGNLLKWFESYLTNRSQCVIVPGGISESKSVTSGVPRDESSIPCSFSFSKTNLPDAVASCNVGTFADDTKVYRVINSPENVTELRTDLDNLRLGRQIGYVI